MSDRLEALFHPIQIGSMRLKNRLVMAPMGTNYGDPQGRVTPRQVAYYAERAKNGVGMVTIEVTSISDTGRAITYQLGAYKDDFIPGLAKLAEAIKRYDCRCSLQLHHAGRRANPQLNGGAIPVAPSPIPSVGREVPRELTLEEIERLIEEFAKGAVRARKAGFDAVELHAAHGYLLAQFLSPLSNQRTDRYGGNTENRARFITEIIARIRKELGDDYPLFVKMSVNEYLPGGLTSSETAIIGRILQDAGANAIVASAGHTGAAPEGFARTIPGAYFFRGCYADLAAVLKKALSVPVGVVGRINDPVLANEILQENKADLIYMGRALLADPELPLKAREGKFEEIRTCIACNMCVKTLNQESRDTDLSCTVNASLGKEETAQIGPAKRSKKVMVVGGGPAGMECARVALLRGHKVYLYEKSGQVGGQLLLASLPPHKEEISHLTRYLWNRVRALGAMIELHRKVTPDFIEQLRPDAVIIATGSTPGLPEIPGVRGENVIFAEDVLAERLSVEDGEIIIVGGGIVGCETGEFLAAKGKKVAIIEMLPEIAEGLEQTTKLHLKERLKEFGVTILTNTRVQRITNKGVLLENGKEIKAGAIILAAGRKAEDTLIGLLSEKVVEVYAIGDCREPRMIIDAIREGAEVGLKI